ncbi:hypothetical protein QVD17_05129 [Tagetes erecta]|uniref:Uncharacterized protein n=1 Tax=Tagetes erecta TaxID=13708 RepID=A0AAD8LGU9_TARER|nr:hypothetical protein QVD17_05129 [Tagetes erecta]
MAIPLVCMPHGRELTLKSIIVRSRDKNETFFYHTNTQQEILNKEPSTSSSLIFTSLPLLTLSLSSNTL